jgi:hypothetical protein
MPPQGLCDPVRSSIVDIIADPLALIILCFLPFMLSFLSQILLAMAVTSRLPIWGNAVPAALDSHNQFPPFSFLWSLSARILATFGCHPQ